MSKDTQARMSEQEFAGHYERRPEVRPVLGVYDDKWREALPELPERYWLECPRCRGVFAVFHRGINPWQSPALTSGCVVKRDGSPFFDSDRPRLVETVRCGDCGEPIGALGGELISLPKWWRKGDALPPKAVRNA